MKPLEEYELVPVFKKGYAQKLRMMGNPIIDCSSNRRNPNFVIYYFENTEKFKKDFLEVSKDK